MEELVGHCHSCEKPVYCENGFLNGVHEEQQLYCTDCYSKKERDT
ncbi:hypothetical protein [Aquisalibacillus elongatus]|uniref:Uncharacterized protein n=1 Tax=Aquisalibacillus elongatus TaxID=485577 RepID=A0A3N5B4C9_9BACI|nr:hypothetical protein [Aquisalibacillus elongatus]RPF52264.1 hypothetical protein EDC24_2257 [Aquisalibacillus elongatus]